MSSPAEETPPKPASLAARIAKAPWRLIGIVLLIIVLLNIDLKHVLAQLAQIGAGPVALAALAFILLLVGRYWRWRALTRAIGARQPFWQLISSCNRSIWLGLATPGRIGEFRRAADLALVRNWSLAAATALVLIDILIDLGCYVAFGVAGSLYLSNSEWGAILALGVVGAAAAVLLLFGSVVGGAVKAVPILLRIPGFSGVLPALRDGFDLSTALQVVGATSLAMMGYVAAVWALIYPMQPALSLLEVGTAVGLAGMAGAIPITYFGLGTRDLVLVSFFGYLGRPAEEAVALSICFLLVQLIGIAVSLAMAPLIGLAARRERPGNNRVDHAG